MVCVCMRVCVCYACMDDLCVHLCLCIPYSGSLSWVKTFANFAVLGHVAKVLAAKIFIAYTATLLSTSMPLSFATNHGRFHRKKPTFSNSRKFSPAKDSRYTVYVYMHKM